MLATPPPHRRRWRTLAVAIALSLGGASGSAMAAAPTLRDVLAAARAALEVRQAQQGERGAEGDVLSADHAPLPTLSGKLSQIDLQNGVGAGDPLGRKRIDKSIGIDWTWERGDKRRHRTTAAERLLAAARADTAETALQQMLSAQAAYFDWLGARERLRLLREMATLASEAGTTANRRRDAGDLSAQDALRATIDGERAALDLQAAQTDLARTELALSPWVARAALLDARTERVQWPQPPAPAPGATLAGDDEAIAARGDVRAAQARLDAARAALDGALALRKVDPTWGVSYDHYPGVSTRLIELRVQIPLTFGYRYEGEIARAQADLSHAELAAERTQRDARIDRERLVAEARSARDRARRFGADIVEHAATVLRQAEFAFARGAMPLTDLLDARRTWRSTQLDALAAEVDAAKAETALQLRVDPERLLR